MVVGSYGSGTYGSGTYGGTSDGNDIDLTFQPTQAAGIVKISWTNPPGTVGHLYYLNGNRVSRDLVADRTSTRIAAKKGDQVAVEAVRFEVLAGGQVTV